MPFKKTVMRKWQGFNLFSSNDEASEFISGALEAQQIATQTVNMDFFNSLCNLLNRDKRSAFIE